MMSMLGDISSMSQSNRPPLRQDSTTYMSKEEQERIANDIKESLE